MLGGIDRGVQAAIEAAKAAARAAAEAAAKAAAEAAAKRAAEEAAKRTAAQQADKLTAQDGASRLNAAVKSDMGDSPFGAIGHMVEGVKEAVKTAGQQIEVQQNKGEIAGTGEPAADAPKEGHSETADTVDEANDTLETARDLADKGNDTAQELLDERTHNIQSRRDALPPEAREHYDHAREAASKSGVDGAADAVDQILLDRKPAQAAKIVEGLDRLAHETMAESLDRIDGDRNTATRLAGEIAVHIAHPETIQQDAKYNSCTGAALEKRLAMENPARYIEMTRQLASADDHLVLGGGVKGLRTKELEESFKGAGPNRSMTSGLFQQTLLAWYGSGDGQSAISGNQLDLLTSHLFPGSELRTFDSPAAKEAAILGFDKGTTAILHDAEGNNHAVTVSSVNEDGSVTYQDPLGENTTSSAEDFRKMLKGAIVPQDSPVADSHDRDWDVGNGRFRPVNTSSAGEF